MLGIRECVRKGWASNHAPITTWSGPGAYLKGIRRTEGKARQAGWIANRTEQDNLSRETTKQHQTPATTSNPSESPNTGAPPPHGDALVAYESLKREKNSEGNESGEKKFDMNVCRV